MIHSGHNWTLHNADCREVLAGMADASVDCVVTDPPYGTASESKVQTHGGKTCEGFNLDWDRTLPMFWLADALRVTVDGGACIAFTDNKCVTDLWRAMETAGWRPLQTLVWVKPNPPPQPRQNFCSGVETAIFARKPGKVHCWNGGGATVNWRAFPLVSALERKHSTQKPVALMAWLVRLVTPPNGLVLDPFAGSGTTGVAALKERMRFVGCELSPEYAAIAKARLEDAARQPDLFAAEVRR